MTERSAPSGFLDVTLQAGTLDRWLIRNRILEALREALPSISGVVLDVGCGAQPYRAVVMSPPSRAVTYIGLDIPSDLYQGLDVAWDGRTMPLADECVDQVLLTEVLEHCPDPDRVLAEAFRVLRPAGRVFFTVPFLWPLHDVPYDEYRYTPFALERILGTAGFGEVTIRALGGWDASLAQMLGLWLRRRPMRGWLRAVLSRLAVPVIRGLARVDRRPSAFVEGTMLTGLCGSAVKVPAG